MVGGSYANVKVEGMPTQHFYEYVNINPLVFPLCTFLAPLPALYSPQEVFLIR